MAWVVHNVTLSSSKERADAGRSKGPAVSFLPFGRYTSEMQRAHFIGIAGKGMSATALYLRERGWHISGSDQGAYPPVSDYLARAGIHFKTGYKKENIPEDVDLIVIGKNAKLVPELNEEVAAAVTRGVPIKSFPEIIGVFSGQKETVVIAGSYGKSTCTALIAWCLRGAGKDPSYFIGEITNGFEAHAHAGEGPLFVIEGDEYPSSNWDAAPKFLHYHAKNLLLTSATHDHVNVYPTHEEYLKPFERLIASLPRDGFIAVNHDEQFADKLAKQYKGNVVTYGMHTNAQWYPDSIVYGEETTFDLMHEGKKVTSISTTLLGAHNIENSAGCAALLLEKRWLAVEEVVSGIASFKGVKRRLETISTHSRVPVLEGFGSSYEKARSAIEAVKLHYPDRKIVVVFEPHTFGWRNRANLSQYAHAFDGAGRVFIAPPELQGADTHAQLSHEEILKAAGARATPYTTEAVVTSLTEDDVVLILTSGSLEGTIPELLAFITAAFPS